MDGLMVFVDSEVDKDRSGRVGRMVLALEVDEDGMCRVAVEKASAK